MHSEWIASDPKPDAHFGYPRVLAALARRRDGGMETDWRRLLANTVRHPNRLAMIVR